MVKRWLAIGALLLLVIQTIIQVKLADTDSQTTDEAVHLSAGYTYLTRGDWRFNPEHPPLVKILAALPLLAIKPHVTTEMEDAWAKSSDLSYDSWKENRAFGEAMLYKAGNNPDQLLFWGRMPMVALTLLLGVVIFWIAFKHWGATAALTATALYTFNPIVNGHGHLITTDIAISLGFLLSVYSFWQLLERPTWRWSLLWALAFGFSLLVKHTAIILLPTFLVLLVISLIQQRRGFDWRQVLLKSAVGLLLVWALVWAGFGFHDNVSGYQVVRTSNPDPVVITDPKTDPDDTLSRSISRLLPANYLKGLSLVIDHASDGHVSYLLGQESLTGWWYYFPILFLLKTPLAMLIIFGGAAYLIVARRPRSSLVIGLIASGAVFLLVAMDSKANLGVRHILPIFPLLTIASAWAVTVDRRFRTATFAFLAWLLATSVLSYPTYLGYFNELAGGSKNGYKVATDSNLDWGQDLKRIKIYIDAHPNKKPYVDYSWAGKSSLDYYLGTENYQRIENWQPGMTGLAIFGATAYNFPPFNERCIALEKIAPGLFSCWLTN